MNFHEIHIDMPVGIPVILIMVALPLMIFIAIDIGFKIYNNKENPEGKKPFILELFILLIIVATSTIFLINVVSLPGENRAALVHNIQEKYEVDEVKLQAYDVITYPTSTNEQKVHVIVDGDAYMFYLSQDKNTWEPTLIDPPINGGNTQDSPPLKAKDILK